jgi:hypothetical protein
MFQLSSAYTFTKQEREAGIMAALPGLQGSDDEGRDSWLESRILLESARFICEILEVIPHY